MNKLLRKVNKLNNILFASANSTAKAQQENAIGYLVCNNKCEIYEFLRRYIWLFGSFLNGLFGKNHPSISNNASLDRLILDRLVSILALLNRHGLAVSSISPSGSLSSYNIHFIPYLVVYKIPLKLICCKLSPSNSTS